VNTPAVLCLEHLPEIQISLKAAGDGAAVLAILASAKLRCNDSRITWRQLASLVDTLADLAGDGPPLHRITPRLAENGVQTYLINRAWMIVARRGPGAGSTIRARQLEGAREERFKGIMGHLSAAQRTDNPGRTKK
jgi:hypothetical protein